MRNRRRRAASRGGSTSIADNAELARSLVEVYRPYIQELVYTFHGRNIRELYKQLSAADAERHPFRPDRIDWKDYWINVHLPGLRQHIFPQLDLHTRTRPRALLRHKTLIEMLDRAAERYGARVALEARKPFRPAHRDDLSRVARRRPCAPDCCCARAVSSPRTGCC